jgi:hypothetical protein
MGETGNALLGPLDEFVEIVNDGCDKESLSSSPPAPLSRESGAEGVRPSSDKATPCKSTVDEGDASQTVPISLRTPIGKGGVVAAIAGRGTQRLASSLGIGLSGMGCATGAD